MAVKKASTKKKAAAKKGVTKKKAATKKSASQATKKVGPAIKGKAMTQAQVIKHLAESADLPATQVKAMFAELGDLAERHLKKGAVGAFTVPGLVRMRTRTRPATKARQGVNPFTGAPMKIAAKPARRVVKAAPVKGLKDVVEKK